MSEPDYLREALARAVLLAQGLFEMIDRDTWRDCGGDDGQGHYEGDYHAEKVSAELTELSRLAEVRANDFAAIVNEDNPEHPF